MEFTSSVSNQTRFDNPFNKEESLILLITLIVIIIGSCFGSFIMIIVLWTNKKMWTTTNLLIGNLAINGLLLAVFTMPFALITPSTGHWRFGDGPICQMEGFSGSLLLLTSIFTHTMISMDKYFAVVKPLGRVMTIPRTYGCLAFVWFLAAIISLLPLLGMGRYEYNHTTYVCGVGFPRTKVDKIVLQLLALFGFLIPTAIMVYVYIMIYSAVKQHKSRLEKHGMVNHQMIKLQKRLIATVLFSLLAFLVCWLPFCIFTLLGATLSSRDAIPRGLGIAAYWCGYSNSAINPMIFCAMNSRFKEGCLKIHHKCRQLLMYVVCCNCFISKEDTRQKEAQDAVALATGLDTKSKYNTFADS